MRQITDVPRAPGREPDAHKGSLGRVLVVGGSIGMVGAPSLVANGALRSGAGLVIAAVPACIQQTVAGLCPCAITVPLACEQDGSLGNEAVAQVLAEARRCDVLAVGPGLGVGSRQRDIVSVALSQHKPVVLDADGLNNLPNMPGWPAIRHCPLVLTPHPGELSRLTGLKIQELQANRQSSAADAARKWQASEKAPQLIVALKGAGTVITDGKDVYLNDTGNPGMATGGTGDVLTGVIASLIGQGMSPMDAACLGVWAHGRAGDLAAEQLGQALIATDLLDYLPAALKE